MRFLSFLRTRSHRVLPPVQVDVGSLNGTRLNGIHIGRPNRAAGEWHALRHGDVVHFGERDESPAARVALLPPPPSTPPPGGGHPLEALFAAAAAAGGADLSSSGAAAAAAAATQGFRFTAGVADADADACTSAAAHMPSSPYAAAQHAPHAQQAGLRLRMGIREEAARGRPSEDRWLAECPLRGHPNAALYAVFDGHCGAGAAERAAALLPEELSRALSAAGPLPCHSGDDDDSGGDGGGVGCAEALRAAFAATDAALKCEYEGCAATAVLVWRDAPETPSTPSRAASAGGASPSGRGGWSGVASPPPPPPRRLFVQAANVGDAAAALAARYPCWLCDGGGSPPAPLATHPSQAPHTPHGASRPPPALLPPLRSLRLTEDHKVKSPSERARLKARGIELRDGETRLYGLALSRALGDSFLKEDAASGLSAEPFVSRVACVHAGEGAFALLASDGLWDVVAPPAAVELASRAREGSGASGSGDAAAEDAACAQQQGGWGAAAAALLAAARARRSRDDVTVLLVGLDAQAGEG
jgi:serine/threonine protein phosphatase PrpC